jgi:hypothetical protein
VTLDAAPPKKKRVKPKGPSPTRLSLDECERRGWFITRDLFNIIDIVAITPSGILGIQATSGTNHSSRVNKAFAEPRLIAWLQVGGRFAVWSWDKDGFLREEEAHIKPKEQEA